MPLLRENVASMYQQIAALLRAEIERGLYEPSGKLPSEAEIGRRFAVSRVTVRLALAKLSEQGAVERKQGKGTYAAGKQVRHGLDHLRSFHESLLSQGLKAEMRLLARALVALPERIGALAGTDGGRCLLLERLHLVDGEPLALGRSYLPPSLEQLGWQRTESEPTYALLAEVTGLAVARAEVAIRLGFADTEVARTLKLEAGQPLLVMERSSFFGDQRCCDRSLFYIRPERYEFVVKTSFAAAPG